MAGIFKEAVLTTKGIALLAKAQAEKKTIELTRAATGNGTYEDGEDIAALTALKSYQQEFALTTVKRQNETNVFVQFTITNNPSYGSLAHGYYVTEVGLFANDPDEGEILYALAIGETDQWDYLPAYNSLLPATIAVSFLIEVANSDDVTITTGIDAYASIEDLNAKADAIGFNEETSEIYLKANNQVISKVKIAVAASGVALATEEDIREIVDELMEDFITKEDIEEMDIGGGGGEGGQGTTDEEVEEAIGNLDDL